MGHQVKLLSRSENIIGGYKKIRIGFLCYDLQPFTEDCLYRIGQDIAPIRLTGYPVFFHPNQERSRVSYRPSHLKGKHLGVNVAGSTPEGFASNINWCAAWNCVRESDIIILYGLQGATALLIGLLNLFMRRTVISVNRTLPAVWERKRRWWVRWLKQWLLNRCKFHIYQTQAAKEVLTSVYGIDEKQLFCAPFEAGASWFDSILQQQRGCRDQVRQKMGLTDEVLFLFVGNLVSFKGIDDLVRAASLMPKDSKYACVFAGPEVPNNKQDINYFLAEARRLGIEQYVRFTGELPPEKLAAMYWAADVVVLPTKKDCTPKVLVEAALASKAIITTNAHGWVGSLVRDGENAIVIEPGDIVALAEAMKMLLDSDLREKFGRRSKEIVEVVCDLQKETDGYAAAVKQALLNSNCA